MDLHGLGALAGGVKALFFSHQSLIGNPYEENRFFFTLYYSLKQLDKNTMIFVTASWRQMKVTAFRTSYNT